MGSVSASVTSVQRLIEQSPSVPETHSSPGDLKPGFYGDYIIGLIGQGKHLKGKDFNDYLFLFKIQVNSDRLQKKKKRTLFLNTCSCQGTLYRKEYLHILVWFHNFPARQIALVRGLVSFIPVKFFLEKFVSYLSKEYKLFACPPKNF